MIHQTASHPVIAHGAVQNSTHQIDRLSILFGRLFQLSLTRPNPPITLLHKPEQGRLVFLLESVHAGIVGIGSNVVLELLENSVRVGFRAGAEVHFLALVMGSSPASASCLRFLTFHGRGTRSSRGEK